MQAGLSFHPRQGNAFNELALGDEEDQDERQDTDQSSSQQHCKFAPLY
jgi:hypothetical protein